MTEISATAPTVSQGLKASRPRLPRFAIGASLAAIAILIGNALSMAYVSPYLRRRETLVAPDENLKGRDPSW